MDTCPIPSYPKIWRLGSVEAGNVLNGTVEITEKVDGSQFAFGRLPDTSELVMRSKGQRLGWGPDGGSTNGMFRLPIKHVLSVKDRIPPGVTFYAEAVTSLKHNRIEYARLPKGSLVLYAVAVYGGWVENDNMCRSWVTQHEVLENYARLLDIDVAPLIYKGIAPDGIDQKTLDRESFLGGDKIEGVVIKNYETESLSPYSKENFAKLVRPDFQEVGKNLGKHASPDKNLAEYLKGFQSPARWDKAIDKLRDSNALGGTASDIGIIVKEIGNDLFTEEEATIKQSLFGLYKKEILRYATRGFAEHYFKIIGQQAPKVEA